MRWNEQRRKRSAGNVQCVVAHEASVPANHNFFHSICRRRNSPRLGTLCSRRLGNSAIHYDLISSALWLRHRDLRVALAEAAEIWFL